MKELINQFSEELLLFEEIEAIKIKTIRTDFKWSQDELATITGTSRSTVYRWETNGIRHLNTASDLLMNNLVKIHANDTAKHIIKKLISELENLELNKDELNVRKLIIIQLATQYIGSFLSIHPKLYQTINEKLIPKVETHLKYIMSEKDFESKKYMKNAEESLKAKKDMIKNSFNSFLDNFLNESTEDNITSEILNNYKKFVNDNKWKFLKFADFSNTEKKTLDED